MSNKDKITIKGAKVNNLKNVNVEIPREKLTVITGLSGSGKSSLAFDTLYAEGQRRYVESLSSYARQFLGRMPKPQVDFIQGLPPAIAIEQKVNTRNPRSTVGTSTEIYDFLRLLFGRVGHTFSPVSGKEVKKHTVNDVIKALENIEEGVRFAIASPLSLPSGRDVNSHLDILLKQGYSRLISLEGEIRSISEFGEEENIDEWFLLVDRSKTSRAKDEMSRIAESAETAFFEGKGELRLYIWKEAKPDILIFSNRFESDGITFREPDEQLFNFNNPYGACPTCEGFGKILGIDENLVIPDKTLSVYDDAVACWKGEKMSEWKKELIRLSNKLNFPVHRPYNELTLEEKDLLWHGNEYFPGIDGFFRMVDENQYKIQYRVLKARYRGRTVCPDCHGSRLKKETSYIKINGRTISDLVKLPVSELREWFANLKLEGNDTVIGARILKEINNRLAFLDDVGLGYLTLDRLSSSLSGGESQRINLATSLGSSLVGSLYILDEPSIGLHSRDTQRLINVLRNLKEIGNTVVIVEHDEDIMRAADYIVDVGKDAGSNGGNIIFQGTPDALKTVPESYTNRFLSGIDVNAVPAHRRKWKDSVIIEGAIENNLKNITVEFPLNVMTVVSGVSGSGKSTLVRDILYKGMMRNLGEAGDAPGSYRKMGGELRKIKHVEFIDQNPIGKSSRSNPATYLKAFDEIRHLMAEQQLSKQMGYTPAYFSFNTEGGRCEECKGEGSVTVEMQFMSDITIECEECHGKRFKKDILEVEYHGKNIHDILELTVDEAIEFFSEHKGLTENHIVKKLQPLHDVGLGYIKIGQSSSTLSGGENQRVKLAYFLSIEKPEPTLFIFDEPTTGLHFHDISKLLDSFNRLIEKGHTLVIIEHNLEIIKMADHVIDMGPEGGNEGGNVVATGTPEQIANTPDSYTGKFLKEKLG